MLDYLVNLAGSLPEDKSRAFYESDLRLRIESIKARLTGRPGLREDIKRYVPESEHVLGREPVAVTSKRVHDTFGYIRDLSEYHPDRKVAEALKTRLQFVMNELE